MNHKEGIDISEQEEEKEEGSSLKPTNTTDRKETPEDKSLGERIREARKAKGFTQQQLADSIGVARSTITSIELGNNKPDIGTQKLLVKFLELSPEFFLTKSSSNNISLGEILFEARSKLFMTQEELAELSFISQDTISLIERNKITPRKPTLITISQALQLEPKILLEKIELEKIRRKMLAVVDGTEEE